LKGGILHEKLSDKYLLEKWFVGNTKASRSHRNKGLFKLMKLELFNRDNERIEFTIQIIVRFKVLFLKVKVCKFDSSESMANHQFIHGCNSKNFKLLEQNQPYFF